MTAPLDVLRGELRYQCSFEEIAELICQHGPVSRLVFASVERTDAAHTRFGGTGDRPTPWYETPKTTFSYPGWEIEMRWIAKSGMPTHIWETRSWLQNLGMIHMDAGGKVDCHMVDGIRVVSQAAVLFAKDFPAMWLADRLRGTWA